MLVKGEIFCLALQLSKNQVYNLSMEKIIRSLSIKPNFTRMRVFQVEDEAFVIHTQVGVNCHYFRHVTFNVHNKK